jgi:hypothetical protein
MTIFLTACGGNGTSDGGTTATAVPTPAQGGATSPSPDPTPAHGVDTVAATPEPAPSPPSQSATVPPDSDDTVYTDGDTTITLKSNGDIDIKEGSGISGNGPPASGLLPSSYCTRNGDDIVGITDAFPLEDPDGRYYSERMLYKFTISGDELSYSRTHILNYDGELGDEYDIVVFSVSTVLRLD